MVRFSLETGLRRSNVTGLQWLQVDLVRRAAWIHPDQAKARKAIPVPLSNVAVEVIRKQIGEHPANVFSFRGKPLYHVNTKAWHKALKRVGIENFRWHDLQAHLGKLAHSGGHSAARIAGVGRVVIAGDGAEVCAPIQ